jgi:hypothetical protein
MPGWDCSPNPERGKGEVYDQEERRLATDADLQTLCAEWQKTLRLQDWDVKVRIVRRSQFRISDAQGECEWLLPKKTALIHIVDPIDYPPNSVWEQDMERTLVHELLHCHMAGFDDFEYGSPKDVAVEQAVESIAKALVSLKRKG